MKYEKYLEVEQEAWDNFLDTFAQYGINRRDVANTLHNKDAFNDVQDAILSVVVLECEDE